MIMIIITIIISGITIQAELHNVVVAKIDGFSIFFP